jgi:O-succinylhomoserine sulfhydrylase
MKFETKAIRIQTDRTQQKEHSTPIYPTSSFVFDDAEEMRAAFAEEVPSHIYSRYSNPTVAEFEQKMAALEGGEAAMATASGMSAIFTFFACNLKMGDHVLISQAVFGSTIKQFENFFNQWGIQHDLVLGSSTEVWEAAIKSNTKIIFLETPSNPGLEIFDIEAISKLTKPRGILLAIDNCFATPYLQQPLAFGADVSIHSATKYIDGQGRVLGGVIISTEAQIKKILPFIRNAGPTLSPFNAWILSKSLETLHVRMDRHCENAATLADMLTQNNLISKVNYPFLPSHPSQKLAMIQMKKGGGMVSFEMKGGYEAAKKVIDNVKTFSISPNLGDTRTIITHPASSTHSKLSIEQREAVGITQGLIRISVGLEHIDDISEDLFSALGMN